SASQDVVARGEKSRWNQGRCQSARSRRQRFSKSLPVKKGARSRIDGYETKPVHPKVAGCTARHLGASASVARNVRGASRGESPPSIIDQREPSVPVIDPSCLGSRDWRHVMRRSDRPDRGGDSQCPKRPHLNSSVSLHKEPRT